jgi:hypothetical protein
MAAVLETRYETVPGAKTNVHELAADGMGAGTGGAGIGVPAAGARELAQPMRHATESNWERRIRRILITLITSAQCIVW